MYLVSLMLTEVDDMGNTSVIEETVLSEEESRGDAREFFFRLIDEAVDIQMHEDF